MCRWLSVLNYVIFNTVVLGIPKFNAETDVARFEIWIIQQNAVAKLTTKLFESILFTRKQKNQQDILLRHKAYK